MLEGWRKTKEIGNISNRTLITKLLGADERSENRIIAQSLSLFNSLGIEDDVRKEMIFVATNKNITSIEGENEIKERKFDTLIHDYLGRRLLDRKGRFVFIRPLPIAWYLMCEWLTDCSKDRLRKVLEDIRTSEVSASLAPAFGAQFKDMSMSGKAIEMLDEILHVGSPFSDAEVINTEVGSRLFRSFVEVAPQTVAKCLYNALANKKLLIFITSLKVDVILFGLLKNFVSIRLHSQKEQNLCCVSVVLRLRIYQTMQQVNLWHCFQYTYLRQPFH